MDSIDKFNKPIQHLFISKHIVLEDRIIDGGIVVDENGKIIEVVEQSEFDRILHGRDVITDVHIYRSEYIMPGIIDTHVHVNEPGRTDWEGFESATKAAAKGGITTIIDMPLNSIPSTTTLENLKTKVNSAKNKCYVNVGFWGGVVPGNENELLGMVEAGVVGFKCFLTPSGVDEFQFVQMEDVEKAAEILQKTDAVLAFHAEIDEKIDVDGDTTKYETFLKTRPETMEENAIKKIIELGEKYKNLKLHVVHLSAATTLGELENAKIKRGNLTVETCHHYLSLKSESIPNKATEFKCCPPIRNEKNMEKLWKIGLGRDIIDSVVSDHSPSTIDLKFAGNGDFLKAWGGISSIQFGLSLFWTEASKRGYTIFDINKYMTRSTAKLVGLHKRKGLLKPGFDADFVIWNPEECFVVEKESIEFKNKITPYMGMTLKGKVCATVVRGKVVYNNSWISENPEGKLLINENLLD